jgi:hypothetical protein
MSSRVSAFFLFVTCTLSGFGAGINFPTESSCISPDLRWSIRCVTEEQSDGYLHKLYLSRFLTNKEVAIYASGRNCDVLWSDDGERLAITDWLGSNVSEIYLIDVSLPTKAVPLAVNDVQKIVQKDELEGHCYYEALKWEAPHRLIIRIFGHTDENSSHGFAYYLSVDTLSGVARFVKKENEEPNQQSELSKSAPT